MIKAVFYFEDNSVTIHQENTKEVETNFKPGLYKCNIVQNKFLINMLEFKEVHKPFKSQNSYIIIDAINKFLLNENKEKCNELGYIYKLNTLIYGKQGVGKTALINYICDTLVKKHNAIVFRVDSMSNLLDTWILAEGIRKIQDTLMIFILDEFDQYCAKNEESMMKNLLDGNRSLDNTIIFGATNYIDRVPNTFKERPSRFRLTFQMEAIDDEVIVKGIINGIISKSKSSLMTEKEVSELAHKVMPCTIDEIKTAILDRIMNISLDMPETKTVGFSKNDLDKVSDTELEGWYEIQSAFDTTRQVVRNTPSQKMGGAGKIFNHLDSSNLEE
jgi:replication-associated recombination protein RarA